MTDEHLLYDRDLVSWVEGLVRGGVGIVQFRNKSLPHDDFVREGRLLKNILSPHGVPLIVNDRVEAAIDIGADGVHIGQNDMPYPEARVQLGKKAIIGLSVENLGQVLEANHWNVDYIGLGSVFPTSTKQDVRTVWGLEGLKAIRQLSPHHIMAIGGITISNVASVVGAGADSIAVVSALCKGHDPTFEAKTFLNAMKKNVALRRKRVLSVAGSDPTGGAGLQADLKTITTLGHFGMAIPTALTNQNTKGVSEVFAVDSGFVGRQMASVLSDLDADVVKVGMLCNSSIVLEVARRLKQFGFGTTAKPVVLDPLLRSTMGDKRLLDDKGFLALVQSLLPLAQVVTPNVKEASILSAHPVGTAADLQTVALKIRSMGCGCVVITGFGEGNDESTDLLLTEDDEGEAVFRWFSSRKIQTTNSHGTGCAFATSLACFLSEGFLPSEAVPLAKQFVERALLGGKSEFVGSGYGSIDHNASANASRRATMQARLSVGRNLKC